MPTGGLGSGGSDEGSVAFSRSRFPSTAKTVVRIKAPSSGRVRLIGWHSASPHRRGTIRRCGSRSAGYRPTGPLPRARRAGRGRTLDHVPDLDRHPQRLRRTDVFRLSPRGAPTVTQPFAFDSPADRPSPGIGIAGGGMLGFECEYAAAASVSGPDRVHGGPVAGGMTGAPCPWNPRKFPPASATGGRPK